MLHASLPFDVATGRMLGSITGVYRSRLSPRAMYRRAGGQAPVRADDVRWAGRASHVEGEAACWRSCESGLCRQQARRNAWRAP